MISEVHAQAELIAQVIVNGRPDQYTGGYATETLSLDLSEARFAKLRIASTLFEQIAECRSS